jgi:hypothetical protein
MASDASQRNITDEQQRTHRVEHDRAWPPVRMERLHDTMHEHAGYPTTSTGEKRL